MHLEWWSILPRKSSPENKNALGMMIYWWQGLQNKGKEKMTKLIHYSVEQIMMWRISSCHGDVLWLIGCAAAPRRSSHSLLHSEWIRWYSREICLPLAQAWKYRVGKIREFYNMISTENNISCKCTHIHNYSSKHLRRQFNIQKHNTNKKSFIRETESKLQSSIRFGGRIIWWIINIGSEHFAQ